MDVLRRHHSLTALERVKLVHVKNQINGIAMIAKASFRHGLKDRLTRSRKLLLPLFEQHHAIALVNDNDILHYITIDSLKDEEIPINFSLRISPNFVVYTMDFGFRQSIKL